MPFDDELVSRALGSASRDRVLELSDDIERYLIKYLALTRAPAPQVVEPERIEQVLGVDVGVAVLAYGSDGSQHHMPDESGATAVIKDAQRRRARCSRGSRRHDKRGSRRHDKRGCRLATMQRRRPPRTGAATRAVTSQRRLSRRPASVP